MSVSVVPVLLFVSDLSSHHCDSLWSEARVEYLIPILKNAKRKTKNNMKIRHQSESTARRVLLHGERPSNVRTQKVKGRVTKRGQKGEIR